LFNSEPPGGGPILLLLPIGGLLLRWLLLLLKKYKLLPKKNQGTQQAFKRHTRAKTYFPFISQNKMNP
jgi:hypothetical protein